MQVKPFFYGDFVARIRTIKPEFPQSESMGRVSRESRLCFILLFTLADDSGRLRGNSRMLASLLYPYDDDARKHIDSWLNELSKEGCIVKYESDGDQYIELSQWSKHQKIDKPTASKIPPPSEDSRGFARIREMSSEDSIKEGIKERKGKDMDNPPDGVSANVWADFKKLRTAKKSPLTQTALDGIARQAAKAGLTLSTVLEMCCERGWVGFKAEWVHEKRNAYLPPQPSDTVPSKQGIDPTLAKLDAEAKFVKPPSAEMRQKLEALRKGVLQ